MWPNPHKPRSTGVSGDTNELYFHTIGYSDGYDVEVLSGGSMYVSASHRHTPDFLNTFISKMPDHIRINGHDVSKPESSTIENRGMVDRYWWALIPYQAKPKDTFELDWEVYEYRAQNIEGVEIHGDKGANENEVVTRGLPLENITSYRKVILHAQVPVRTVSHVPGPDGTMNYHTTLDIYGKNIKFTSEPGEWQQMPH